MNKIQLQPGDFFCVTFPGFLSWIVQIVQWPLLKKALRFILSHCGFYVQGNTTFESSVKGSTLYNLDTMKKAKRLVIIRCNKMNDPEKQKQFIRNVHARVAKHENYGYVNYPLRWLSVAPIIIIPFLILMWFLTESFILLFYTFIVGLILYFPVTWWMRKVQRNTKICSELVGRTLQEPKKKYGMGINIGCKDYESYMPNNVYELGFRKGFNILIDFNPLKDGWLLEEYNG